MIIIRIRIRIQDEMVSASKTQECTKTTVPNKVYQECRYEGRRRHAILWGMVESSGGLWTERNWFASIQDNSIWLWPTATNNTGRQRRGTAARQQQLINNSFFVVVWHKVRVRILRMDPSLGAMNNTNLFFLGGSADVDERPPTFGRNKKSPIYICTSFWRKMDSQKGRKNTKMVLQESVDLLISPSNAPRPSVPSSSSYLMHKLFIRVK
jgi:hypothetical protein